jgi:hypothetical protein
MNPPADPRHEWSDERLAAAFGMRFGDDPPNGLTDRIHLELARTHAPRAGERRWLPAELGRWRRSPLGSLVALGILVVAVSILWLGTPRTTAPGTPAPDPSTITRASAPPGQPWPAAITVPGSDRPQPVLSVAEAIEIRDAGTSREIAVGGWFTSNPVPCPGSDVDMRSLEDCAIDYTWLMASPEDLRLEGLGNETSSGLYVIRDPIGPAINAVLRYVDWPEPPGGQVSPVVFVGHFHDTRAADCPAGERHDRCEARFVVDEVAWTASGPNDLAAAPVTVFGLDVIDVSKAISVRDAGSAEELAVAGWYQSPGGLPFACPFQPIPGVPFLEPLCEGGFTWLMQDAESLIDRSDTRTSMQPPAGPAVQPVFAGPNPPSVALPPTGASIPVPVVFVGHFNDRRSSLCTSGQTLRAAEAACRSRFVVDAVAWDNGSEPAPETMDWREVTDPHPSPWVDPLGSFSSGTFLGMLIVPGSRIGEIEPALARDPIDLSTSQSLWVVTILELPTGARLAPTGAQPASPSDSAEGAVARTLVLTVAAIYEDSGVDFIPIAPLH